jgi:hypothetical protein
MTSVESLLHDYLELNPDEQARFLRLLPLDAAPSEEWWEAVVPELEERRARFARGESRSISGDESVARVWAQVRASRD